MAVVGKLCGTCGNVIPNTIKNHVYKNKSMSVGESSTSVYMQFKPENKISTSIIQPIKDSTFEELLIAAVSVRRPLWDYKMPVIERSKGIKNRLWLEIHQELDSNFEIKTIENKWKYLKEEYTRRKNSVSGSGSSKDWCHMRQLRFLDDIVIYKPTITNVETASSTTPASDISAINKNKIRNCTQDNIGLLLSELKTIKPSSPPQFPEATSDKKYCQYLCSIMTPLSKNKKLKLQAKFINDILNESD